MSDKNHGLNPEEHGRVVKEGYDRIAEDYTAKRDEFNNSDQIKEFLSLLPKGGVVLDIGCGGGVPVLRMLVDHGFDAKGIDFSEGMLAVAAKNVPEAKLIQGDITSHEFPSESFDGVISTYAFIHIHKTLHQDIYSKIFQWLKPGGIMYVGTAADEWEEIAEYFEVKMAWSHPSAKESLRHIMNTGFEIIDDRIITTNNETHYWILARKKNPEEK